MKMHGKKIEGPNVEICVIPRGDGRPDIVFKAQAVLDNTEFDQLCPRPTPPMLMLPGGEKKQDVDDPAFKKRNMEYGIKQIAWLIIKSLEATPGLEWERVKLSNPETWLFFEDELKDSGFSLVEIGRIRQTCYAANALSEERLQEARDSFLSGLKSPQKMPLSQKEEASDTPFGELANGSGSDHPTSEILGMSATKPASSE